MGAVVNTQRAVVVPKVLLWLRKGAVVATRGCGGYIRGAVVATQRGYGGYTGSRWWLHRGTVVDTQRGGGIVIKRLWWIHGG
jgi:transcriptional regulator CtsR